MKKINIIGNAISSLFFSLLAIGFYERNSESGIWFGVLVLSLILAFFSGRAYSMGKHADCSDLLEGKVCKVLGYHFIKDVGEYFLLDLFDGNVVLLHQSQKEMEEREDLETKPVIGHLWIYKESVFKKYQLKEGDEWPWEITPPTPPTPTSTPVVTPPSADSGLDTSADG